MKKITTSLIISTYNWPDALELSLLSILNQTILPNEVIVADDGSSEDTKKIIEKFILVFPVPLIHVWHEDKGFRLAMIRNKAIAKASFEYIIQIDGDMILHKNFVEDHVNFAKPNSFVRASRCYINKDRIEFVLKNKKADFHYYSKGITNRFSAFHFPLAGKIYEYKYKMDEPYEIHVGNMAFWRSNALNVNGYNEDFVGWGPEDKEFVVRLLNRGFTKRFLKQGGIAFHIWHPENTKPNIQVNEDIFAASIEQKKSYCENGVNKYLEHANG
jgi:glycosyltransferase involved in cell wall biosynthesis